MVYDFQGIHSNPMHVKSPGFAGWLSVLYFISRSPVRSSKSPGFQWNQNNQILPNLPNWVWITVFISVWVWSTVFVFVVSQCQLINSSNCNRLWTNKSNAETVTVTGLYKRQKCRHWRRRWRRGQQIGQWPELELFKSHLTLMTDYWKQSNKYLGALPTPCLSLTLFTRFRLSGAPRTIPKPYYRPSYMFRSCRAVNSLTSTHIMAIHTCACLKVYVRLLGITILVRKTCKWKTFFLTGECMLILMSPILPLSPWLRLAYK